MQEPAAHVAVSTSSAGNEPGERDHAPLTEQMNAMGQQLQHQMNANHLQVLASLGQMQHEYVCLSPLG